MAGTTFYKNPEYVANYDDWVKARDLYAGNHDVLSSPKYLQLHSIENNEKDAEAGKLRVAREQRTRYRNLTEIAVSMWQSLYFRQPPTPNKDLQALLKPYNGEDNIDGMKTSLVSFAKDKVLPSQLNYGRSIIICDAFPIQPRNMKEQKENKIRPYMDIVMPLDAPDWCIEYGIPEKIGEFIFFRHEFYGMMPRTRPDIEPVLRKFSRTLILEKGKYVIKENYVNVGSNFRCSAEHWNKELNAESWQTGETFETKLTKIPVAINYGSSWLKDPNEESLRYHNIRSNKDNILHIQGYQDRYIKGVSPNDAQAYAKAFNEYVVKFLPENGEAFALPPVDPIAYERAEQESIIAFFQIALNKLHVMPIDAKAVQGADTLNKESEPTYALVEAELQNLENLFKEAFQNYAMFEGKEGGDYCLEFNKNITPESFQQFMDTWGMFRDLLAKVPGATAAGVKKGIKKLGFTAEEEENLLKEVDKVNFDQLLQESQQGAEPDHIGNVLNGG